MSGGMSIPVLVVLQLFRVQVFLFVLFFLWKATIPSQGERMKERCKFLKCCVGTEASSRHLPAVWQEYRPSAALKDFFQSGDTVDQNHPVGAWLGCAY